MLGCVLFLLAIVHGSQCNYKVLNWKYHFPPGSAMGILVAAAIPLTNINQDAYVAINFEASYKLPGNQTFFDYPPLVPDQKSFGRRSIYESIISKYDSRGYPGKMCLLRNICEAASYSMEHTNGVLGDLFHFLLTPSASSESEDDYFFDHKMAEDIGKKYEGCDKYHECKVNFLDLLSFVK